MEKEDDKDMHKADAAMRVTWSQSRAGIQEYRTNDVEAKESKGPEFYQMIT
jgi:hypothetical protein